MDNKIYYWGVWPGEGSGHALMTPDGEIAKFALAEIPWKEAQLDGGALTDNIGGRFKPEGIATLKHSSGWTMLSFWDRSGDERNESVSTFVVEGKYQFQGMKSLCRTSFPSVWERFTFEVTPWQEALKQRTIRNYEVDPPDGKTTQAVPEHPKKALHSQ